MVFDGKERHLQVAIAKAISLHSNYFEPVIVDVNVKEYRDKGTGKVRKILTQETPGVSDLIIAAPNNKVIWMEVKLPHKKQSDSQVAFQQKMERIGHDYHVVHSVYQAMIEMIAWAECFWQERGVEVRTVRKHLLPRYYAMRDQLAFVESTGGD